MREILSTRDARQLKFLEFLMERRHNWILLKTISTQLSVPLRTLQTDIQELNASIKPIEIRSSTKGVKLVIPPAYSERYLYQKILQQSLAFQFIEYIFINEAKTIPQLAEVFHVSDSTIKRIIKKINQTFEKEAFSIQTNPVMLLGDERKITQFMSFYFYERYFFQEEYLSTHQINLMGRLVDTTLKDLGKEAYFPNFKRIFTRVYLNCTRLKHHRKPPISFERPFSISLLTDHTFCEQFEKAFAVPLTPTTLQLLFSIFSRKEYLLNTKELQILIEKDADQHTLYNKIKHLLKALAKALDLPLPKAVEDKLLLDLMNIINSKNISCYHHFMLYNQRERFLSKLSESYIYVSNIMKKQLKENLSLDFNEQEWNELNYILLTHWSDLYAKFRFNETPIPVFLLIDTDIEHGQLVKRELETYSRYQLNVEVMMDSSIHQIETLSKDSILITNVPGIQIKDSPSLCFEEFFSPQDWQTLDKLLEKIVSSRKNMTFN